MSNENKCPVSSGPNKKTSVGAASNQDWWPNQLNLNILHQHDKKSDPCLLYTSPSPRDPKTSRMPSSA